ncbi:MAG: hypothetical protein IT193_01170 [Propionibacteriaceae bacterium]|nr:hypothetical protein [Propionibacteriaceae bacterium]
MIDFATLATTAAVGTGTRPLLAADLPGPIAGAIAPEVRAGDQPDPADLLLQAAAGYSILRAARVPDGPDLPPLQLPPPSRPAAPDEVVALLHRLRSSATLRDSLQQETLAAVGARGLTLPADLLLSLFSELARPGVPAGAVRAVAGLLDQRGWALVGLDPVWAEALRRAGTAADPLESRTWEVGGAAQRAEHLASVRRVDPAAGLALLEPVIATEPPEVRELFVWQLREGLGAADETFLEARLDDRAKAVRTAAAALLALLPGSGYVARAEALARQSVHRRQRLLRPTVTVVDGIEATAATRRDLYREKDRDLTRPERLHLADALAIVPPGRWPALVGATAIELATGPAEYHDTPIDLRPAFAAAALRWRDAELAEALAAGDPNLLSPLLPVLHPAARDRLVAAALGGGSGADLLTRIVQVPMSPRVAVAALEAIRVLARSRPRHHLVIGLLGPLAVHADPLVAPALVDGLRAFERALDKEAGPALRRAIADASAALQLRQAITEALLPYPVLTPTVPQEG